MDSTDYVECDICKTYEICLITDVFGPESGLFTCGEHHFCKQCITKPHLEQILAIYDGFDEDEDELPWVPKELCPVCQKNAITEEQENKLHKDINMIFHQLWTQAAAQDGYVKHRWEDFQKLLNRAGISV